MPSFNDALKNTHAVLAQSLFNILNNILNSFDSNADTDHHQSCTTDLILTLHNDESDDGNGGGGGVARESVVVVAPRDHSAESVVPPLYRAS